MTLYQKFNLSESDTMQFRTVFEAILGKRSRPVVTLEDVLRYFVSAVRFIFCDISSYQDNYPVTEISKWVLQAINPANPGKLSFAEYVHMICYFVMLARLDLIKFLFGELTFLYFC